MKLKIHILIFSFMLFGMVAFAQHTVSGTVTDSDGAPLIGVNILEQGTTNGSVTDFDGNFSIETASSDATLLLSYTGFEEQTVALNGRSILNLTMTEGVALDEVVVTALGISREKKSLTYATQSVNTAELSQAREINVINSLQGKVAGLSISPSGAGVGGASG